MPVPPFIPPDWTWVYDLVVGQEWPQANEDSLRNCAQAWTNALSQLVAISGGGDVAAQNVGYSVQSVSSDQFDQYWKQYTTGDDSAVGQLAQQCEVLADQLLQFAEQTEFTKLSIDIQIVILVIQLIIDAATAIITAGGSTAEGIAAAFVTRLTVRAMLEQLLRAVLAAVLPDVITQTIMLAEGHRSSYDIGETLQAAQMGVIGGAIGIGLGALGNKIGLTQALTKGGVLGGLLNAGIHGAVTADLTNAATGLADAGEQALVDPGAQQTYGMAQEKSGQNPFMAALNGAFTGMLFHGVHETGTALGGGNHFEPTPFELDNGQSFNAVQIRDGTGSNYALFDDNMKLVGTGTLDKGGGLSVTPNGSDPFTAQVTNLTPQPASGSDQPLALGGANGNDGTTPPGPSDDPTRLAGADQQPTVPTGPVQPVETPPQVTNVPPSVHDAAPAGALPEITTPQTPFQLETQPGEVPVPAQAPVIPSQDAMAAGPAAPPVPSPEAMPHGLTGDTSLTQPPVTELTSDQPPVVGLPGQVMGDVSQQSAPQVPGSATGNQQNEPGATQLAGYGATAQLPDLAGRPVPSPELPPHATASTKADQLAGNAQAAGELEESVAAAAMAQPGEVPGLAVVPDDVHGLRVPAEGFTQRMESYAAQLTQPPVDFRGLTPDQIVEREPVIGDEFGSGSEDARAVGFELADRYRDAPSSKVSIGQTRAVAADLNARGLSQDDAITAWKAFYSSAMDGYGPAYRYANGDVVIAAANPGFTDVIVIDPRGVSAPGTTISNDILGGTLGEVSPRLPGPDRSGDTVAFGSSTLAADIHAGSQATVEGKPVAKGDPVIVDQPASPPEEAGQAHSSQILDALKVELVHDGEPGAEHQGVSHHGTPSQNSPAADASAELQSAEHVAPGSSTSHEWPADFREVSVPEHPEWAGKIHVKDGLVVIGDDPELARGTQQQTSDGTVIIKAHGREGEVFLSQESQESISFSDPAFIRMLTEAGLEPGQDVILACCEAGLNGGAADQLAAMLPGTGVIAANTAVWDDHQGGLFAANEKVVNGMPMPTLLADENGAFHPHGIWEAHNAGTETVPLSESDPRHPPVPAELNPSLKYTELAGLRDFGYRTEQFGARPPNSPLAEVVDAVARHDNATAISPDPALTGRWLLDSSVDVSLIMTNPQRDVLNMALRDYANDLLDRATGAATFQQLLDDRRANVDLLGNSGLRQQQVHTMSDKIMEWTDKVNDATAKIQQLAPERARLARLSDENNQVNADIRQVRRDLDAAKQAGQPTLELTKRFNDLNDRSRELHRDMQSINQRLNLADDDLTKAQKNLKTATTKLTKAFAAASASPRAVDNMLDETAAMNRNPGLPIGRQRLPLSSAESSTEPLQVHTIPIELIWRGDGSPRLAYVVFPDGVGGSYPSLLDRLTDLRATYQSRVPSGPSFDAQYANALLDLAKVPAGQTEIPLSLRTLADGLYTPQAVTAFLGNPDWSGANPVGTFFKDAAATMVLQVGVEGARNPSALVTNVMAWDMVAHGKLDLDQALGYLNVMGPVGSVRIGLASDAFSGPKGPAAIDEAASGIAKLADVTRELGNADNVRELIERFPAIRSNSQLFDPKGDLLPGYDSQLLTKELSRMYVNQSVAEMELRQRQIVTLYAATMRPQAVPEDSSGVAMLNNFLYGSGDPNQPGTAVAQLMNNLLIRLGW